jgi:formiminotetrahydrofolate cyclodeaminase
MQEKTITQFAHELSSKAHIPGGGAVAALNGACAASLISMVINLTIGKEDFAAYEDKLKTALDEAVNARDDMLDGMRRDAAAFDSLMSCFKLPKGTKEEKQERKAKLQAGYKAAAGEPLAAMIRGRKMLDAIGDLIPITNPMLVSDLGLAAINAAACSKGALLNVRINLPYIKDEEFANDAETKISETQSGIDDLLALTLDKVYAVMKGE